MARVLLLGCPEGYAAALPAGVHATAANELGEPRASVQPDLVVIGPASSEASVLAQRVGRAFPGVDVLIAAPGSEVPRLKDLLKISPYIPLRTDLVSSEPKELVEQAIRGAVARCDLRRGHRAVLDSARRSLATAGSGAAGAASTARTASTPPSPYAAAPDLERRRLLRFFYFYEPVRSAVLQDVARATPDFSAAAPVLRSFSVGSASSAGAAESDLDMARCERAALLEGAWEPYVRALHTVGRTHAELGFGFGPWLEISHQFRRGLVGRLQQQGLELEHFADVILGMESFLRITSCEIERAYAEAHRALLQRLEANGRLFAVAVEASDAAFFAASLDGTITAHNPAAERLLGYRSGEALGRQLCDLAREDLRDAVAMRLAEAARGISTRGFETIWRSQQGQQLQVSLTVSPVKGVEGRAVGLSIVAQDITKQKQTEESLRQTQKMEAVGRLAGGVAHDFNNLLTVIMAHTSLMSSAEEQEPPDHEALSEILQAATRARDLTQQLLSFSRGQPVEPARVDVNEAVRSTHQLLRRTLGESIEISVLSSEELWPVWIDQSQLQQLLMNLALNARDAMPAGGKLSIQLQNETLLDTLGALSAGDYVRLRISDTGIGMASDVLSHVFEPFFTTKPMGKGTGVGLATCHAIARRAGGDICVVSELGRGATFSIWLPRAAQTRRPAAAPPRAPDAGSLSGSETVLIVEDDPAVRAAAALALEKHGYRVLQAHNGDDAQRLVERHPSIGLVLTDVVMPQMSGPELAAQLAKTRPELPVLFMSGYAEASVLSREMLARAAIISKPFLPQDLARKVRQVLDGH